MTIIPLLASDAALARENFRPAGIDWAEITKPQLRMMRHALGLEIANGHGVPFRNLYVAGVSQTPDWDYLVARGFALCMERYRHGLSSFTLTEAGMARARRS